MENKTQGLPGMLGTVKVGGLPLGLYLLALALLAAMLALDCLPASIVGAFFLLMILGDGMNKLGAIIPVVKTYLGGSVMCIFGGAILALLGVFPEGAMATVDAFVNDQGFLVLYIAALITGSLFSIDRGLLLKGAVRILPVSIAAVFAGALVCGGMGVLMGQGFWDAILFILVPMTSGGMTAGTVPLSQVYSAQLGVDAGVILTRMAPATVLGNCIAIVYASLANTLGRKKPQWTGNGRLVNDGQPAPVQAPLKPTLEQLAGGMTLSLAFYGVGALLHHLVPMVPTYAWMIITVVVVKCMGVMPAAMEDAARQWGQFAIKAWTAAALFGIGMTLIDLETIAADLTLPYLLTVLLIETTITLTAAFVGRLVSFYPIESAIAAGMCATNMGGSGNVAVLSSSDRMDLLPFAQIVTRGSGALMLTIGGILVQYVG